jgi:hypothetical protein
MEKINDVNETLENSPSIELSESERNKELNKSFSGTLGIFSDVNEITNDEASDRGDQQDNLFNTFQ